MCENQHKLNACPSFLSLSIEDRIKQARTHKLCLNCLRENHVAKNCFSKSCCRECNKRHHSLLHLENRASNDTEITDVQEGPSNASYVCKFSSSEVLLSTAYVNVRDAGGKWQQCRALLDVGSQSNLISENLSNLVRTSFKNVNMPVSGIGSLNRDIKRVTQISPLNDRGNTFDLSCLVIPKITENLPVKSFDKRRLHQTRRQWAQLPAGKPPRSRRLPNPPWTPTCRRPQPRRPGRPRGTRLGSPPPQPQQQ
jgi:hypothetical protein